MPMAEDLPLDGTGHRARVRERLFDGGYKALHDHEIVEYLLACRSGGRTRRPSPKG